MVYTLYVLWTIFCLIGLVNTCITGKGIKCVREAFPYFFIFATLEGIAMITTLTPPTSGLLGAFLFVVWLWGNIVTGSNILAGKVYTNRDCWLRLISKTLYFAAVTVHYFFVLGA
ncbi:membrane protein [Escherichia phage Av-05]|uniref:Uncharacterized protein n=1 Tax=Escherichia phage Av-05 TaxID=1527519 RepID=A0A076G7Y8_9CAUD|nr:membrane protein [Escherichia phage Av-05]AII27607.1 hypothetical protein Av05_0064 [Escherichia phage Av-05]